ncbi:MAG: class I SAM-dependent methyltransferase [Cellvibrionaceae bacterium]|nr:class I SAM-dependent methyltransferase [Cellvibrionaceae bacterium]
MLDPCPLCHHACREEFFRESSRYYLRCNYCQLVYVPAEFHLSLARERAEYDKHENTDNHPGYRQFLSRLSEPLICLLRQGARGLDFGCGPGPVLSAMIHDRGFSVDIFDPFYFPSSATLRREYDFVTATEVLEHLRQPRQTLDDILRCLRPGGYLGVMTKLVIGAGAFSRWHYKNDPTHIVFFSQHTFRWLCEQLNLHIVYQKNDVVIFRKG